MNTNQRKNQHLYWRAAFGPAPSQLQEIRETKPAALFEALWKAAEKEPGYIDVVDPAFKEKLKGMLDTDEAYRKLSPEDKKTLRQQSQEDIKKLNLQWLEHMTSSPAQLRERMAFFWHGHFACREINIFHQQALLHSIRRNALGNFGELLREVSKSAAMINFLNNNQNRKGHPNENFAREVMELFTMGRGHYTEQDIREAARSFTGWGAGFNGTFVFRIGQHDSGTKTFLGKTGNFNGDDIINILLEQPATAQGITRKLYRFFVNEQVDEQKVTWLSKRFYQGGYAIGPLLKDIFTSSWFYEEKNMGNRIKSPIDLWVGMRRQFPISLKEDKSQLLLQKLLGQVLFYPPNVAGWPGGKTWIDSSSLLLRMRLPQFLASNDGIVDRPKQDDDQEMGRAAKIGRDFGLGLQWESFYPYFETTRREDLLARLSQFILQSASAPDSGILNNYVNTASRQQYISSLTLSLMSCPEYQLC